MKRLFGRPGELRDLFSLGWPMMATQFFIMATGFLDTAMAGRYGVEDLAGVAIGGNILWPVFMLFTGVTMALTPIVAQLRGRNQTANAGNPIVQGMWITLVTSTLMVLCFLNARPLFVFAEVDPAVIEIAMGYLEAVVWGLPAVVLYVALRHACEGLGATRPPMYIAGAVLPLNAALNYAFIYGKWGFPELGGVGCGWATAIVFGIELILMLGFVVRQPFFRATGWLLHLSWPQWTQIRQIVWIGVPIGLSIFVEMVIYSVISLLVARIGVNELAAHSIAGNLNWLTYVLPMSLGAAASIRVGYFVGANKFLRARQAAASAYRFSLAYAVVVSALLVGLRYTLVSAYTTDPAVVDIAVTLMLFIAVYQIVDDSQAVTIGALRGYKDTQIPMVYGMLGYWFIALPFGHALAIGMLGYQPLGVYGYWIGLTVGLILVAIAVGVRLWRTAHDEHRVQRLATSGVTP